MLALKICFAVICKALLVLLTSERPKLEHRTSKMHRYFQIYPAAVAILS